MLVLLQRRRAASRRRDVLDACALIIFVTTLISGAHYVRHLRAPCLGAPRRASALRDAMRQIPLGLRLPDRAVFASFLPARNAEARRARAARRRR